MTTPKIDLISDVHLWGIDFNKRELFLHSHVGDNDEDPGVEYRMACNFIKNLRILDSFSNDAIIVHMHSIGGNWHDGMAIFDSIQVAKSHVTIVVYGQAESMSSIVLQAADSRIMMPNAYFMCHFGSSGFEGHHLNMQNLVLHERKVENKMFDIYAERCVEGEFFQNHYKDPTEEKVKTFLRRRFKEGDWYLEAEGAIHYGFADHILTSDKFLTVDSLK